MKSGVLVDSAVAAVTHALKAMLLVAIATVATTGTAHADCLDEAAQYHHVNPWILRAIAYQESRFNSQAIGHNANGSSDFGAFGANSVHLPELAKYGIGKTDLFDICKGAYVAAWHLSKMVHKYGNTWDAVGAYNGEHRDKMTLYEEKIRRIIDYWMSRGLIPR
jgi:soluble lytic murein transglycosylase-like protein